jgi:hypothetical protein
MANEDALYMPQPDRKPRAASSEAEMQAGPITTKAQPQQATL